MIHFYTFFTSIIFPSFTDMKINFVNDQNTKSELSTSDVTLCSKFLGLSHRMEMTNLFAMPCLTWVCREDPSGMFQQVEGMDSSLGQQIL